MNKTYTFVDKYENEIELFVEFSEYQNNNRIAIQLYDEEGPYATASVNLPDERINEDEVAIKNYSENEGVLDFLISNGFVTNPLRWVKSSHVNIPICRVLKKV